MSREFKQPTSWIYEHFDDFECVLQSGLSLWEKEQRDKAAAKNK